LMSSLFFRCALANNRLARQTKRASSRGAAMRARRASRPKKTQQKSAAAVRRDHNIEIDCPRNALSRAPNAFALFKRAAQASLSSRIVSATHSWCALRCVFCSLQRDTLLRRVGCLRRPPSIGAALPRGQTICTLHGEDYRGIAAVCADASRFPKRAPSPPRAPRSHDGLQDTHSIDPVPSRSSRPRAAHHKQRPNCRAAPYLAPRAARTHFSPQ
jgi:hypothetical protein